MGRIPFRSLLLTVGMAGLLMVLSACGSRTNEAGSSDPNSEAVITIVIAEDPPSFNAAVADTGQDALIMELVMLGLADVDPEGNVFPELAAELPTVENGGVVVDDDSGTMDVTWKLRSDIVWSDGEKVTADDVVFTYEAIIDPEMGFWVPGIDYVDGVEKVDETTVTIHYSAIFPGYLTQFGGEQLVIWPAHYCDPEQGFTAWDCGLKPLSDGPYLLEEWVNNDHLTFVRNPNYYQKGKPSIDRIIVRIVPEQSVRKTMLIQGDADLDMWTLETMVDQFKSQPNVTVSISPYNRWVMRLYLNLAARGTTDAEASPHPVLSDLQVRRAIRMAIDVDTISREVFLGYSEPVWTEFFRPPYACDIPKPKYDPEAAAAMLEEAGWQDTNRDGIRECRGCATAEEGYEMRLELIAYAEYGEALELTQQLLAEQLGAVGIKLDLSLVEGSIMWADSESGGIEQTGNFDIDIWDDGYAGVDPTDFVWGYYHSAAAEPDAGWNIFRWKNETVDGLLDEAYSLDETRRQEIFCEVADIINEEVPTIYLFSVINADAHSNRLVGVQSTINDIVTWNAADWTLAKGE